MPGPAQFAELEEQKKQDAQRLLRDDIKFAAGKIAITQYLIFAVTGFLVVSFWDLQIHHEGFYAQAAERNRVKAVPVLAPRGKILDRHGRVIVDNHASYSLLLSRENLKEEHLAPIAAGLDLDPEELRAKLRRYERRPKYEPMLIKEELTPGEIAFVESHRDGDTFPELELIASHKRLYSQDGVGTHVIGYVGEVSDNELDQPEFASAKPGDIVGKAGIERQYNELLTGEDGQRRVMVDNRGNERQVLGFQPATPGQNLTLTLDLDLQVVAEMALEGRRGAVVALDPRSGEVLALASAPTYNLNLLSGRQSSGEWKRLLTDPEKPLLNRAIQAQFAPGSTFKPIVAMAALETGSVEGDFATSCGGGASWYGRYFRCHQRGGHGSVGFLRAMAGSCDVFFYQLGNRTGIDNIARYATISGLGAKTGIDLPYEASGTVPSTAWKARTQRQKWYAGETISVAIGQGALTVTPVQLAHAIGGLAAGGVWQRPHLIKGAGAPTPARKADFKIDNLLKVINGMHAVVTAGTAGSARLPGIEFCGKTGTAQLASNDFLKSAKLGKSMADNAWFVGFAPRENPEIVVAALFENGEHGTAAGLIARDVVKVYFDKKRQQERVESSLASRRLLPPPPGVAP